MGRKRNSALVAAVKKGRRRFKKFHAIKDARSLEKLQVGRLPKASGYRGILVGMGISPVLWLSDGSMRKASKKIVQVKEPRYAMTDPAGRKIVLLAMKKSKLGKAPSGKKQFIGWVPKTRYYPTKKMVKLGSNKANTIWTHDHNDDGGRWPKAFLDDRGNVIYGSGTYRVQDWIRK